VSIELGENCVEETVRIRRSEKSLTGPTNDHSWSIGMAVYIDDRLGGLRQRRLRHQPTGEQKGS
jgi:hypothetical protein